MSTKPWTPERTAALREALDKSSPGKWALWGGVVMTQRPDLPVGAELMDLSNCYAILRMESKGLDLQRDGRTYNVSFAAQAHNALPDLLAHLERVEAAARDVLSPDPSGKTAWSPSPESLRALAALLKEGA